MSYTKITATPPELNFIRFTYLFSTIMARVQEETQYRARLIKAQDGNILIDEYAISDDEDDILERYSQDAIHKVGDRVNLLTSGINLTGTGAIYTDSSGVYACLVNHEQYNNNILTLIDNQIELMITHYVLSLWWEKCALMDEMKIALVKYNNAKKSLTDIIWELRKPDIDSDPDANSSTEGSTVVIDVVTGVTISDSVEVNQSLSTGSAVNTANYVVEAYDSSMVAIPNFDALITERTASGFTFTAYDDYADVTFLVIGYSTTSEGNSKTLIASAVSITDGVPKLVTHTFGSAVYFVQAIQADGVNVPSFDSIITSRTSTSFEFTSYTAYASLTFLLIGQV